MDGVARCAINVVFGYPRNEAYVPYKSHPEGDYECNITICVEPVSPAGILKVGEVFFGGATSARVPCAPLTNYSLDELLASDRVDGDIRIEDILRERQPSHR